MAFNIGIRNHQAWLGYLQPDGLVVSPAAMVDAQVILDQNILPIQQHFFPFIEEKNINDIEQPAIKDTIEFLTKFLEWPVELLFGINSIRPIPEELKISLSEFGDELHPAYALQKNRPGEEESKWLILGQIIQPGEDFDFVPRGNDRQWSASPAKRFERLLRETNVPIGIISNETHIRLIYAPKGENSGNITFPISAMTEVSGRPILGALYMLIHKKRLFVGPTESRLPSLLEKSREYQSRVSEALSKQVLDSLYELVRGFQAANEKTQGELLREVLATNPNEIYSGLLTTLLRLVFLLYAEDRGLMPNTKLYNEYYSVHKLFEKLRSDDEKFPDTMDQRYGGWSQLLALFRTIFDGCKHTDFLMPARKGFLFDFSRYPFLEGRSTSAQHVPLVSDGVIFRILKNLLLLEGERLSYRTLDVEQIGSVYETMVGFRLEITTGPTIALKPAKSKGAPTAINISELLNATDRIKWIREKTDQKITGGMAESVKDANTIDDVLAALERKIARNASPGILADGSMVLQPSDERRKSGSHYTPRKLTEPIVRKALEPILQRLGDKPTPQQILELKVCDIAVGSGAFLVEASRQLGDELVKAWYNHKALPYIPPDEDEVLHARRLVAQRCLYGVDRNPMAVDLTKLSLWLATLAKEHPFTFLDHSIRCGDSLVGLTSKQIADFHWKEERERVLGQDEVERKIENAARFRKEILEADELVNTETKRQKLEAADEALNYVRLAGNCVIAAFFAADKDRERITKRNEYREQFLEFFRTFNAAKSVKPIVDSLQQGDYPIIPFHWEIEFPEAFTREDAGFDAIVGNPPFLWGNRISTLYGDSYRDWLLYIHVNSHGNSDIVAHFFRRSYELLKNNGSFGLVATNSISEGDTRTTGLLQILNQGGQVFYAVRDTNWPGGASVRIAVVCIYKGIVAGQIEINGRNADKINSDLREFDSSGNIVRLKQNENLSFKGVDFGGIGFLLTEQEKEDILTKYPNENDLIWQVINAEDLVTNVDQGPSRWIINFSNMKLEEASEAIGCMTRVKKNVLPFRLQQRRKANRENWWLYNEPRPGLYSAISNLRNVIISPVVSKFIVFVFSPTNRVFTNALNVFAFENSSSFSVLQSSIHEIWVMKFGSTLESRNRYNPTDCFETFPFPLGYDSNNKLEEVGKEYYDFRTQLMITNNEGLTKTYNRLHDPEDSSEGILRLRELHSEMDGAVLDAYGWDDIQPTYEFLLEYEDDENEEESSGRRRKEPWRYRWPDEIRDEVLARLLALNEERAKEEQLAGLLKEPSPEYGTKKRKSKKKKNSQDNSTQENLF